MLTVVLLKIASDLSFYYTFAGLLAVWLGASPSSILLALIVQSAAFVLSYVLRKSRAASFAVLITQFICFALPGAGIAGLAVMVPPAAYELWLSFKGVFEPESSKQTDIFSLFWKVFLVFALVVMLCGGYSIFMSISMQCGVVCLCGQVLLMRSLRHDRRVYCQKKYQLMNLTMIAAVVLIAWLLSSEAFLGTCLAAVKALYKYVISPIIMVLLYAVLGIVKGIGWLFSFIKIKKADGEDNDIQLNMEGAKEIFGLDAQDTSSEMFDRVMIALGIILAIVIVFFVFRYLARRTSGTEQGKVQEDSRSYAQPEENRAVRKPVGGAVQRVRSYYRKFLKLCDTIGYPLEKSDTSLDVNNKAGRYLGKEEAEELRQIYINARYNDTADKACADKAKELVSKLKKNAGEFK
ncbi:MAG: hypothetical protein ACI3VB_01530 [Oscillospiraceae bacterium]